jgi:hypothetical protein
VKAEGLSMTPPVIDCSGWVGVLLTQAMHAENEAAGRTIFGDEYLQALHSWSDRIIHEIEARSGFILEGCDIAGHTIPRYATIGLKMGEPAWASNHPRTRGITHLAQVVRRPIDGSPFVSESFGSLTDPGISLTPLDDWVVRTRAHCGMKEIWAVDPFFLGSGNQAVATNTTS